MNWQGKRVLVTGAGGFIGSHLAERLVQLAGAGSGWRAADGTLDQNEIHSNLIAAGFG